MIEVWLFSDSNLDGFMHALDVRRVFYEAPRGMRRIVKVEDSDQVRGLVSDWDGEIR